MTKSMITLKTIKHTFDKNFNQKKKYIIWKNIISILVYISKIQKITNRISINDYYSELYFLSCKLKEESTSFSIEIFFMGLILKGRE